MGENEKRKNLESVPKFADKILKQGPQNLHKKIPLKVQEKKRLQNDATDTRSMATTNLFGSQLSTSTAKRKLYKYCIETNQILRMLEYAITMLKRPLSDENSV